MSNQTPTDLVDVSIQAEHAPLGVQLWPTLKPEQARHFTLRSVAVVRNEVRSWVVWTYEDNNIRTFELGELVVARVTPQVAALVAEPQRSLQVPERLVEALRGIAAAVDRTTPDEDEAELAALVLAQLRQM